MALGLQGWSSTYSSLTHDIATAALYSSLVPRPSSTLTFGGPGMPNQIFEWVEPRQRYCTQCHYDNFLGTPTATYSLLEKSGAAAIIGKLLPGSGSCYSIARCSGSPDGLLLGSLDSS